MSVHLHIRYKRWLSSQTYLREHHCGNEKVWAGRGAGGGGRTPDTLGMKSHLAEESREGHLGSRGR